jgi:hypothetical protein
VSGSQLVGEGFMRQIFTAIYLLGAGLALSGCLVPTIAITSGIELVDQTASIRLDKDCSAMHIFTGEEYCLPHTVPSGRTPVYCFKTLGGIDCYDNPDPYAVAETDRAKPSQQLAAPYPGDPVSDPRRKPPKPYSPPFWPPNLNGNSPGS